MFTRRADAGLQPIQEQFNIRPCSGQRQTSDNVTSDKAFNESESAMFSLHLLFTIGQGCSYPPEHQLQAQRQPGLRDWRQYILRRLLEHFLWAVTK